MTTEHDETEAEETITCSMCRGEFSPDGVLQCEGCQEFICSDCAITCRECREHFCDECITDCNSCDRSVCNNCALSCSSCGDTLCSNCSSTCDGCNDTICENCSRSCCSCGNNFCSSCTYSCDDCGEAHCEDCSCTCKTEVDLDYYYNSPEIMEYSCKPDSWKFVKQPWENTTFLGIELEMSFPENLTSDILDIASKFLKGISFWKYDGSINETEESIGPGGELVTTPCTYLSHRKLKWKEALEEFKEAGAISYDAKSCGLHIHTNRNNLSELDQKKLRAFFVYNRDFIKKFSKRSQSSLDSYAYIPEKNKLGMWDNEPDYARHICLNHTEHTLEFRIFRGTLDPIRFRSCLQFVDSIIDFVKNHGYMACINEKAIQYFKEHNKRRYPLLNKYITSLGY